MQHACKFVRNTCVANRRCKLALQVDQCNITLIFSSLTNESFRFRCLCPQHFRSLSQRSSCFSDTTWVSSSLWKRIWRSWLEWHSRYDYGVFTWYGRITYNRAYELVPVPIRGSVFVYMIPVWLVSFWCECFVPEWKSHQAPPYRLKNLFTRLGSVAQKKIIFEICLLPALRTEVKFGNCSSRSEFNCIKITSGFLVRIGCRLRFEAGTLYTALYCQLSYPGFFLMSSVLWRGRAIFPPECYSAHSSLGSRIDEIAFRSFRDRNSSQKTRAVNDSCSMKYLFWTNFPPGKHKTA